MGRTDPDSTVVPDPSSTWAPRPVLAGRYRVGSLLGRGGSAQVHRALDELTGHEVAVKLIRISSPSARRQLKQELIALRLLDLPGVVHLLDDGFEHGHAFMVMDLLAGGNFASLGEKAGWETWREQAFMMLEALGRVHFLRMVHGDLKPANILLDAKRRPVITDFGLAMGSTVSDETGWRAGTPRYMAPEQHTGAPCDARTDLYAVGVMFREMVGGPPTALTAVFDAMCAPEPGDRPDSVLEVLDALGRGTKELFGSVEDLPSRASIEELSSLFVDRKPSFLHLAHDAAAELHRRTGGDRARVNLELQRWVRAGRCHWKQGRLTIDRRAIDALALESSPDGEASLEVAQDLHAQGKTARALAMLEALAGPPEGELAYVLVDLTLSLWRVEAVQHAIYLARRHDWAASLDVLRAALVVMRDSPERAIALLETCTPPPQLEGWRIGLAIHSSGRLPAAKAPMAAWLERADAWAGDTPEHKARVASWRARSAYLGGRFAEALLLERAGLAGAETPLVRLSRLTTAAAAALEAPAMDQALDWATEAAALARALGHPIAEARAVWLQRTVALRTGQAREPRLAWVEAAEVVSLPIAAQLALTEATSAWRGGRIELAGELALRSASLFASTAQGGGQALALALAWLCGRGALPDADAVAHIGPELALQVHALAALGGCALGAPPDVNWTSIRHRWLDVLTGEQCYRALNDV